MQSRSGTWIYSPSDLIQFLGNEAVTWFERFDKERPGVLVRDADSESDRLVQLSGEEHEKKFLDQVIAERGEVVNLQDHPDAAAKTLEAMRLGRDVIYQARLEFGEFAGYADFLFRVEGSSDLGGYHYELWDTKLARGLKPYFVIQLCCYAELPEGVQGKRPDHIAQEMLAEIPTEPGDDKERWRVHALLAHLLEFHRREHKPSWWLLFERAGMTEQELVEDPDCLGGLHTSRRNVPADSLVLGWRI